MTDKLQPITNAEIKETMLGFEDHNHLTCWLTLDYGGGVQGFGGYNLGSVRMSFIARILAVTGARQWKDLVGKNVRVKRADNLLNAKILAIGHIIEDKWLTIAELENGNFDA